MFRSQKYFCRIVPNSPFLASVFEQVYFLPKEKQKWQKKGRACWGFSVAFWTFSLAIAFSLITRFLLHSFQSIIFSFFLLLLIIIIGIVFDIIGTAVTAASEKPFHAKAAKRIFGAKMGIYLVRNADRVANFCNDVVGDICGIVSGITAAVIVVNISLAKPSLNEIALSILLAGLVSALTVGGKAFGKTIAIKEPTDIVFFCARILASFSNIIKGKNKNNQ